MLRFKQFIVENVSKKDIGIYYHEAPHYFKYGDSIKSLAMKIGHEAAKQEYHDKMLEPKSNPHASRLAHIHSQYVHLHDPHQMKPEEWDFSRTRLFELHIPKKEVERDKIEYDHPMVKGEIPHKYIKRVWNPEEQQWEKWRGQPHPYLLP